MVYHVDPLRATFRRIFSNGGIGIVEMIYRCNLLAIVGGGSNPRYPPTKVMIWDDCQNKCIGELMFKSEVYAVKLRRDRIVVVLANKVYVYRFKDLKLLDQIQTISNPKGLVSLCADSANNVLAVPGVTEGTIRIELYNISKATILKAHDTSLAQFALSFDGTKIASASEKGTLIRIWDCASGELLRELRRGMDRAEIHCIAFNFTATRLACTSDKGTVHIFNIFGNSGASTGSITASSSSSSSSSTFYNNSNSNGSINNSSTPASSSSSNSIAPGASSDASSRARASSLEKTDTSSVSTGSTPGGAGNKSLNLGIFGNLIPASLRPKYLDSEWSFAQIHGVVGKAIVAFGRDSDKVFVVSADGGFKARLCSEPGECKELVEDNFMAGSSGLAAGGGTALEGGSLLFDDAEYGSGDNKQTSNSTGTI